MAIEIDDQLSLGIVAIGRNEGERLKRCLRAAVKCARHVVYVDSGSEDDSVGFARSIGVEVVELDLSITFTAARARNAGYRRLIEVAPETSHIQFLDGDCELVDDYLDRALAAFAGTEKLAVVSGRRRERYPESSIYNRLCDLEWDTPIGEATACHGDATFLRDAFEDAGLFNESLIAGEEPDLSVRLRQKGWRLLRIDSEMTLHDAAMTRFGQWWKRNKRAGYAFAQGSAMHGGLPERHKVRETRSNWLWGLYYPLLLLALAWPSMGWSLLGFFAYPLMAIRITRWRFRKFNDSLSDSLLYGTFTMIGKYPAMLGQLRYRIDRSRGKQGQLIEYKTASS